MVSSTRQRKGISGSQSPAVKGEGRRKGGGNGSGGGKADKAEDVQARAMRSAWQVPKKTLAVGFLLPIAGKIFSVGQMDKWIGTQLAACCAISCAGFFLTVHVIPQVAPMLVNKLYGVDIGSRGLGGPTDGDRVPESLGLVSSTVFMLCIGCMQFLFSSQNDQLLEYNTALLAICFATLLGLVDDCIDIKWRHKLPVALLMTLPILMSYKGTTSIVLPRAMAPMLAHGGAEKPFLSQALEFIPSVSIEASGRLVELGYLYYVYMAALVVFCTNAINIYAGINGLEVGQSIVIAGSVAFMNLIDLAARGGTETDILTGDGRNHLFSLMIMLPFIATSFGLLFFNFYPAKVFVGDVYPYYAGMTFAVAAILGHFSKSFLFLYIPQVLNFLYSLPQLFKIVPIPRHRLPRVNHKTGWMHASKVAEGDPRSNMTLICLALDIFGPMHERTLCVLLLGFQLFCSFLGLGLRYALSDM